MTKSDLDIVPDKEIGLDLTIDTEICAVMDYFEIFLGRHGALPQGGGEVRGPLFPDHQQPEDDVR